MIRFSAGNARAIFGGRWGIGEEVGDGRDGKDRGGPRIADGRWQMADGKGEKRMNRTEGIRDRREERD